MTPEDRGFLQTAGQILTLDLVVLSCIFLGLWGLAFASFLARGISTWARKILLTALALSLPLTISKQLSNIAAFYLAAKGATIDLKTGDIIDAETEPFIILADWGTQINIFINDLVVLWRLWILYPEQHGIAMIPCLIFSGTFATGLTALVYESSLAKNLGTNVQATGTSVSLTANIANDLTNSTLILSLATNLAATLLILYRLWTQRRVIRTIQTVDKSLTPGQRVLLVLIESGFIFCAIQVMFIVISFVPVTTLAAGTILDLFGSIFFGTMPMFLPAISMLLHNNNTIVETFGFSTVDQQLENAADAESTLTHPSQRHSEVDETESQSWRR